MLIQLSDSVWCEPHGIVSIEATELGGVLSDGGARHFVRVKNRITTGNRCVFGGSEEGIATYILDATSKDHAKEIARDIARKVGAEVIEPKVDPAPIAGDHLTT